MDYVRYPYAPIINRPPIAWPNGARVAFYVGLNIEYFSIDQSDSLTPNARQPDVMFHALRDYGARVGVFRIMDVLDKHGVRASVLLNSDVCREYAPIIEEGKKRGWEWLGHGVTNHVRMNDYPPEKEREVIRQIKETIAGAVGAAPKGWLGPGLAETYHTPDHLAAEGFEYICDWGCDDQPIAMRVESGRMVAVPYQQGLNDMTLLVNSIYSGPEYFQAICDQFDVLYAESEKGGRVMALPIHPFVVGLPFRAKYLDKALEYICSHEKVWVTTSGEIADWFYQHYYEGAGK